jgi:hypothetical protein
MTHVTGLDKESIAMRTPIHRTGVLRLTLTRRHWTDLPLGRDDSPFAPYLRRWIGRHAARHRELLLNIDAASRLRLVPVVVSS